MPVNIFLVWDGARGRLHLRHVRARRFLMTPLLIFIGVSPAVAVASVASHIAASSCSGAIKLLEPARGGYVALARGGGYMACHAGHRHRRRDANENQERRHQEAAADTEHAGM